jgi:hypothetical protein
MDEVVRTNEDRARESLTPSLVAPLPDEEDAKDGSVDSSRACLKQSLRSTIPCLTSGSFYLLDKADVDLS